MTRPRRAIVHIGHKKTGTSAIQRLCHRKRDALLGHGVLYPLPRANHSFAMSGLFRRGGGNGSPSAIDPYLAARDGGLRALDAELAGAEWHTLLLSAESIAGFTPEQLAGLHGWLHGHVETIGIVFVVRDPVDWAVSVAQQNLKTRGDVAAVLARPEPVRWRTIVTRMRDVFGGDAVSVLEYEALSAGRDLFAARFARAAGLPAGVADVLGVTPATANQSLSMEAALMLGRFNARAAQRVDGVRNPARSGVEPQAFAGLAGNRFDLPDATRRLAHERSRADVAFLAAEFGITRYSYPASALAPSRYTEDVSPAFLDAVADRLVALDAAATAGRMLLDAQRLGVAGDRAAALALLRTAAGRYSQDPRVARALADADPPPRRVPLRR